MGLFAPDNGIINVPLFLRTLYRLAQSYGAHLHQYTSVTKAEACLEGWRVNSTNADNSPVTHVAQKLIVTSGAYTNHILAPSFNMHLDLDIWEMTATYFSVNSGPHGTVFPSMWFQFAEDEDQQSRLFYGFPVLPWGPPNLARISVDAATRQIKDPKERQTSVINPQDVANVQAFVEKHVAGVDSTVPAYSLTCLQTNVFG
jgi:sarcosine oxidase/L-pipecolate oxidase